MALHGHSEVVWWQVLAPYDAEDARGLLKAAIRDPDPVVFLENEILYGEAFPVDDKILDKDFTVPIGKVKVLCLISLCICLYCVVVSELAFIFTATPNQYR